MNRPAASDEATRRRMVRQRRSGTAPELAIRRQLHARGMRFRVDLPLSGSRRRGDIVFIRARVVVFVDGCFWHGCPQHGTTPKRNTEWWRAKITTNIERDRDTDARLRAEGWLVLRVWEHESLGEAAERIASAIGDRLQPRGRDCHV